MKQFLSVLFIRIENISIKMRNIMLLFYSKIFLQWNMNT